LIRQNLPGDHALYVKKRKKKQTLRPDSGEMGWKVVHEGLLEPKRHLVGLNEPGMARLISYEYLSLS